MNSIPDLNEAIEDLVQIVDAGLLNDLKESIACALRERPRSDFDAYPGLKRNVDGFGALLANWTGLPLSLCKLAALNHLLPSNRSRTALKALHEYADRLRAAETQQKASTIIAAERRRVAAQRRRVS